MKRIRIFALALLLLAPVASVLAECPQTPAGFHTYVGVDVSARKMTFGHEFGNSSLALLRLQVVWLSDDPQRRYRDKNVIDIDWVNRSHGNVDVYDGQLQSIRVRDVHPVELAADTDFNTGQVHIITCDQAFNDQTGAVLVFAFYGLDGVIDFGQTRVSTLTGRPTFSVQTAVINSTASTAITNHFNGGIDLRVLDDVALATGVQAAHFLAQSILIQNLAPTQELLMLNPAVFFAPVNARVLQNRVYVTGDNASAMVPGSVASITGDGFEIMAPGRQVQNLENHIGIVQIHSRFSEEIFYNQVIEGRADIEYEATACVDGRSRITARFKHPSDQAGEIGLYAEDSPDPFGRGTSISNFVTCERDYRLESTRRYRFGRQSGTLSKDGPIWIPLATTGTLVRVHFSPAIIGGLTPVTIPSVETVLKLFDVDDIEMLYGTHEYFCDPPGDAQIDTIDEIAARRATLLTAEEQLVLGPHSDPADNRHAWDDSNGDGSMCDSAERSIESRGLSIDKITLAVYPPAS